MIFAIPSIIWTSLAFASTGTYEMQMDLAIGGKHIASPHMIVQAGKTATITQTTDSSGVFLEVTPTQPTEKNGVLLTFLIGTIDEAGKRTALGRPRVLVLENQTSQITQIDAKNSAKNLAISVKVSPTQL